MTALSASLALGLHLHRAGRLAQAEAIYREVLDAEPENPDALHLFGVLAHQLGEHGFAIEAISLALRYAPERADFLCNLGDVYRTLHLYPEAGEILSRAIAQDPNNAASHNNLGLVLQALGRAGDATKSYQRALELDRHFPEAHNNLGNAWKDQRLLDRAEASYRQALALRPDYPEVHHNLGTLFKEIGAWRQATAQFEAALALRPDYPPARFGLTMAQLPVIYQSEAEIEERRQAYHQELLRLDRYIRQEAGDPQRLSQAVGSHQPFFLAYQGRNDRDLQALYGQAAAAAMARRFPEPAQLPVPAPGEKIRIGIVSGYFCNHSVWKIPIRGWLSQLDRRRFRIHCYHTRAQIDAETREAEGFADRFVQGPLPLDQWRALILADAPHTLLYPELGMDPVSAQLASQRLAKVQCNSWGHPVPSGLPTLDYFLSSALMEPENGQDHYTETLVPLPNLSVYYEPLELPKTLITRADFGLPEDAVVYWCCQSLYKYLPQHDTVFPKIARAVGDRCRFIFIAHRAGDVVSAIFWQRLEAAFAAEGLRAADYCVLLPRLSPDRFLAFGTVCDVFLDSIGWSGCNSTLEALLCNLPVVTLPGAVMRSRHSMAVLRAIGVEETIASTVEDYIAIAARLGTDRGWRSTIAQKIAANQHRAYRDPACIKALEAFFQQVTRAAPHTNDRRTS